MLTVTSILSKRGDESITGLEIPWRFAPSASRKYDEVSNPSGLISFATAEITSVQRELEEYVAANVKISGAAFSYSYSTSGGPDFPATLAAFLNSHFAPFTPVLPSHILVGAGVTSIENMLAFNLGDPGDGIVVSSPIYGRFELDFGNEARLKIIYAEMGDSDSFDQGVVANFELAMKNADSNGTKIRALLISNPSNPLGQCYPLSTLRAILSFCSKHRIHLISDEVYALSVFDTGNPEATTFTSVLSINTDGLINPDYVHVLYGLSKDFGAAGLRIGALITKSLPVYRACSSISRFHPPSGPSIAIANTLLSDTAFTTSYLAKARRNLAAGYQTTTRALDEFGVSYNRKTNAGLFVYADFGPFLPADKVYIAEREREYQLAQHFVDNGVFLHPGEEHNEKLGWFRIVYASLDEKVLTEGLRRLRKALESLPWNPNDGV